MDGRKWENLKPESFSLNAELWKLPYPTLNPLSLYSPPFSFSSSTLRWSFINFLDEEWSRRPCITDVSRSHWALKCKKMELSNLDIYKCPSSKHNIIYYITVCYADAYLHLCRRAPSSLSSEFSQWSRQYIHIPYRRLLGRIKPTWLDNPQPSPPFPNNSLR